MLNNRIIVSRYSSRRRRPAVLIRCQVHDQVAGALRHGDDHGIRIAGDGRRQYAGVYYSESFRASHAAMQIKRFILRFVRNDAILKLKLQLNVLWDQEPP